MQIPGLHSETRERKGVERGREGRTERKREVGGGEPLSEETGMECQDSDRNMEESSTTVFPEKASTSVVSSSL